jgi:hypothetical protein
MRSFGLPLLPLVLTALAVVSPMHSETSQSSKPPVAYEDPEAYAAYSAILAMGGGWKDSKSLLILQDIPPREWPIGSPRGALQGNAEFTTQFDTIFKSFEQANSQSSLLQYHFAIAKPYKILSSAELEAAFRHPTIYHDGWEGFRQSFPDSSGYLIFSAVGFNPEKTIALVYVDYRCGGLCGSSRYYILEKHDGHWVRSTPKGLKSEMTGNS